MPLLKYLKGDFSEMGDSYCFNKVVNTNDLTKDDLVKSKDNESFKIINLITMEFFNPKLNCWEKI